jgi:hypothetical protein
MDYKNNWEKSKERLKAFWNREVTDRCCVSVFAPKKGGAYSPFPMPRDYQERVKYWTDGEFVLKRYRDCFENTYYGGEATPQIFLNLGAAGHAGFFKNARYQFEDTLWFFPTINDYSKDILEFDPESFLYKKTIELAKYYANESKGSFLVSMPDIGGNADALAHLRGSENLLMDLVDEEDQVKAALKKIQEVWLKVNNEVYEIVKDNNEGGGAITWLNTWAPGKHAQMQCDMSVMISPKDYNNFIIPELKAQSEWMDYCLYHLDGMEQLRHLDSLLSLDKLDVIQWTSVEGQPSPLEFIPQLKKIQEAGKCLLIYTNTREFEDLMEQLSSKGLYLLMDAPSEDEANEIIKRAEKLTHE